MDIYGDLPAEANKPLPPPPAPARKSVHNASAAPAKSSMKKRPRPEAASSHSASVSAAPSAASASSSSSSSATPASASTASAPPAVPPPSDPFGLASLIPPPSSDPFGLASFIQSTGAAGEPAKKKKKKKKKVKVKKAGVRFEEPGVEEATAGRAGAGGGGAPPAKQQAQLDAALRKLTDLLALDRKLPKACPVLKKLMASQLRPDTSAAFAGVVRVLLEPPARLRNEASRVATCVVLEQVAAQREAFPAGLQREVDAWLLRSTTCASLFTDDTYVFVKATKAIDAAIAEVADTAAGQDTATKEAIAACLEIMLERHGAGLWARPPVEGTFRAATRVRMCFPEPLRDKLDGWATDLEGKRTGRNVNKHRALLTGTSHPMLNGFKM